MPIVSHYAGTPDISDRLAIPSLIFASITPLVVLARFAYRYSPSNGIRSDDWIILGSLVFSEAIAVSLIVCCHWGLGKHTSDLTSAVVERSLHLHFATDVLYQVSIALTKFSICLFYLKVFSRAQWDRAVCWVLMVFIPAFTLGSILSTILGCSPIERAFSWMSKDEGGTCINRTTLWAMIAAFDVCCYIVIMIVSNFVVWKLEMNKWRKATLFVVVAGGAIVCAASILRVISISRHPSSADPTWYAINESICTVVETSLSIICASIPALHRPSTQAYSAPELARSKDTLFLGFCAGSDSRLPTDRPSTAPTPAAHVNEIPVSPTRSEPTMDTANDPFRPSFELAAKLRMHQSNDHILYRTQNRMTLQNYARNRTPPCDWPAMEDEVARKI